MNRLFWKAESCVCCDLCVSMKTKCWLKQGKRFLPRLTLLSLNSHRRSLSLSFFLLCYFSLLFLLLRYCLFFHLLFSFSFSNARSLSLSLVFVFLCFLFLSLRQNWKGAILNADLGLSPFGMYILLLSLWLGQVFFFMMMFSFSFSHAPALSLSLSLSVCFSYFSIS